MRDSDRNHRAIVEAAVRDAAAGLVTGRCSPEAAVAAVACAAIGDVPISLESAHAQYRAKLVAEVEVLRCGPRRRSAIAIVARRHTDNPHASGVLQRKLRRWCASGAR